MQDEIQAFSEDAFQNTLAVLYHQYLKTVNKVNFTRREIEIIACLANGRGSKAIALILNISFRTVEAHIYNIFKKAELNSKESLINFIEQSGQFSLLRKFYLHLSLQAYFMDSLNKICSLPRSKGSVYIIGFKQEEPKYLSLLKELETTLKQAGFKTSLFLTDTLFIFPNVKKDFHTCTKHHLIYFLSEKSFHAIEAEKHFVNLQDKSTQEVIYLTDNKSSLFEQIPKNHVQYTNRNNKYELFFDVFRLLIDNQQIEKIITDCLEKHKTIQSTLVLPILSLKNNHQALHFYLSFLKNLDRRLLIGFLCLCVSLIVLTIWYASKGFSLGRPQTSVYSELPIPNEAYFLERTALISEINHKLIIQKGIQSIAFIGMGGIGKTTLARHYARNYKKALVWELNAETIENLHRSFEALADNLSQTEEDKILLQQIKDLKENSKRLEKILGFVKHRLKSHSHWILIYDNVENFSDIKKYFPYNADLWGSGKVLITTRNSNMQNCPYINAYLQIPALSYEERKTLFLKVFNSSSEQQKLKTFLDHIPPFPLDVMLAAQYLKNTKSSYDEYLKALYHHETKLTQNHEEILTYSPDYYQTRYSIIKLSIEKMLQEYPQFKELLMLLTLIDSQAMPKFLFESYKDKDIVNDFIKELHYYSLITYDAPLQELTTFSIHRSTQEMLRTYLLKKLNLNLNDRRLYELSEFLEKFIYAIVLEENFPKIRNLISHGETLLKHTSLLTYEQQGYLGCELAGLYILLGNYSDAVNILEKSHDLLSKLPQVNLKTDKIYLKIANILSYKGVTATCMGEYKKALDFIERSLSIYTLYFPNHYLRIAWGKAELGDIYLHLGDYAKGIEYLKESLSFLQARLPQYHPEIVPVLVKLGNAYSYQGNFKVAQEMLEEALLIQRQDMSKSSLRKISWNLGYLGNVYKALGNYVKAQELLQEGKNLYQLYLAENQDIVAWFSIHLGSVLTEMGDYAEAECLLNESLAICQKYLHKDHPYLLLAKYFLGNLYQASGALTKAKAYLEEYLTYYEQVYGKHHIETARTLRSLAKVYMIEGKIDISEVLLKTSLKIFEQHNHSEKYMILETLADLYLSKAKTNPAQSKTLKIKAENYLQEALELIHISFAEDCPHSIRLQSKIDNIKNTE
jgi:tetratricopeptide (TPR) repeat protein